MNIDAWDKAVIAAWHQGWHPEALDAIAPWWRQKETWLPLYALLLVWLLWKMRWRGLALAAAAGATVGLGDYLAASVFKPIFGRIRPCNTVGLLEKLDLLTGCGSGLSMPSAHATNHFALAVFLAVTCFAERPWLRRLGLLWAASIALGQVYVGRHYFSDILVGALLGTALGLFGGWLFERFVPPGSFGSPTSSAAA